MNWYLTVLKKYAVFSGRARRKEYWMFQLFNALIILAYGLVVAVVGPSVIAAADTAAKATAVAGDAEKAAGVASATAALVVAIPFFSSSTGWRYSFRH